MKKGAWLILFLVALASDLVLIQLEKESPRFLSKPLIVIAIMGYFISSTKGIESPLKKWIISALAFSWLGDVFLMLESRNSQFFLFGLSSFLLAHLIYIFFFHHVRLIEKLRGRAWLLLPIAFYYAAMISWLSPHLGDMKVPVRIYAVVISFMFMLALHMLFIPNKKAGWLMATGAFLFLISDSILAINRFYQEFFMGGILIMLTYGFAQLLIVMGAVKYIRD